MSRRESSQIVEKYPDRSAKSSTARKLGKNWSSKRALGFESDDDKGSRQVLGVSKVGSGLHVSLPLTSSEDGLSERKQIGEESVSREFEMFSGITTPLSHVTSSKLSMR